MSSNSEYNFMRKKARTQRLAHGKVYYQHPRISIECEGVRKSTKNFYVCDVPEMLSYSIKKTSRGFGCTSVTKCDPQHQAFNRDFGRNIHPKSVPWSPKLFFLSLQTSQITLHSSCSQKQAAQFCLLGEICVTNKTCQFLYSVFRAYSYDAAGTVATFANSFLKITLTLQGIRIILITNPYTSKLNANVIPLFLYFAEMVFQFFYRAMYTVQSQ